MRVKVAKWGNSLAVRLPKQVAAALRLVEGGEVDLALRGDRLVLARPGALKVPSWEEIVAEMRRLGPEAVPETIDWGPDVGSEIIDDDYSRGELVWDEAAGEFVTRPPRDSGAR